MGEHLTEPRLVREYAVDPQHARNLGERMLNRSDMVKRAEVDYEVERTVGEGQFADISLHQVHGHVACGAAGPRQAQQVVIDVDARERPGSAGIRQCHEADSTAAPCLQHVASRRHAQKTDKQRNLDSRLKVVAPLSAREPATWSSVPTFATCVQRRDSHQLPCRRCQHAAGRHEEEWLAHRTPAPVAAQPDLP